MRHIFLVLLFCLGFAVPALADGRAFPPDDCTPAVPFMAFNGVATNGNTYCINGQNILTNALPGCGPEQIVSFNGTAFYCKDAPAETEEAEALTVPNCGTGEVLTGSGGQLVCVLPSGSGSGTGAACAAKSVTWPAPYDCSGASHCSGSLPNAAHDTVKVLNYAPNNATNQGSATYQCNDGNWVKSGGTCQRVVSPCG